MMIKRTKSKPETEAEAKARHNQEDNRDQERRRIRHLFDDYENRLRIIAARKGQEWKPT